MNAQSQAGAVGYIREGGIQELNDGRMNIALWAEPSFNCRVPVYLTPPAAVPVEALEGLVADLRNEAGDWTNGDVRAVYGRIVDRLTTLIKERSNG